MLLSAALAAAVATLVFYFLELDDANAQIDDQQRQLEEQQQLIDKKETFGAAMQELLTTASRFEGILMSSIVPIEHYESIAGNAWSHRWNAPALDGDIANLRADKVALEGLLSAASTRAATNSTGTMYETVINQLGGGFITSLLDDADSLCEGDVLACVISDDPYTVHFDASDNSTAYMTDWLRTGVAYHEFAHVLQMTNPVPTETALAAFGGDSETMADCFVLTYLDNWALDHRIWTSRYHYWDINIGYGHTCDEPQRQSVRDWYGQLGFRMRPISQA